MIIILFYLLCWLHFIYRVKAGGKFGENGPGLYCCDERCSKADCISAMTVVWGTVLILLFLFCK